MRKGIGYLSEDRKLNGLAVKMTVKENITMANMEAVSRHGFIDKAREATYLQQGAIEARYVSL